MSPDTYRITSYLMTQDDPASIIASQVQPGQPFDFLDHALTQACKEIFWCHKLLNDILDHYDALISQRWTKRSVKSREQLLAYALNHEEGHRPRAHRADIERWFRASLKRNAPEYADIDLFIYPYMTVEDLAKPGILPNLLRMRARHHPIDFVKADAENMRCGIDFGVFDSQGRICEHDSRMYTRFRRATNSKNYLKTIYNTPGAFDHTNKTDIYIHSRIAQLVVWQQQGVMHMLCSCATTLLHDVVIKKLNMSGPAPAIRLDGRPTQVDHRTPYAVEAAFAYSTGLDLDLAVNLVAARRDEVLDDLRSVRADPGFYEAKYKAAVVIQKEQGGRRVTPDKRMSENPFALALIKLLHTAEWWTQVHDACVKAKELEAAFQAPMPDELEDFRRIRYMIVGEISDIVQVISLKRNVPNSFIDKCACPFCSEVFIDDLPDLPTATLANDRDKRFHLLLAFLRECIEHRPRAIAPVCLYVQHDMMKQNATCKRGELPIPQDRLTELCLAATILQQLDLSIFWPMERRSMMPDEKRVKLHFKGKELGNKTKVSKLTQALTRIVDQHGTLTSQQFYYPGHQRRTEQNVRAMRTAEDNLQKLWTLIDSTVLARHDGVYSEFILDFLRAPRDALQTPSWADMRTQLRITEQDVNELNSAVANAHFELQYRTEKTLQTDTPQRSTTGKVKSKAKKSVSPGHQTAEVEPVAPLHPVQPPEVVQAPIEVSRRALKVFNTIFFVPSPNGMPGQVSWLDFMHALDSAGMTAQKQQGSAWSFFPRNSSGSISFHEPHPSDKLEFWTARHYGRRLANAYGWHSGSFVLASKKADSEE